MRENNGRRATHRHIAHGAHMSREGMLQSTVGAPDADAAIAKAAHNQPCIGRNAILTWGEGETGRMSTAAAVSPHRQPLPLLLAAGTHHEGIGSLQCVPALRAQDVVHVDCTSVQTRVEHLSNNLAVADGCGAALKTARVTARA